MCSSPGRLVHRCLQLGVFMVMPFVWTSPALAQDSAAEAAVAVLMLQGKECDQQGDQTRQQVSQADENHQRTDDLIANEVRLYQCAIDAYTKAIAKAPDNVEAYRLRGMAFAKRDQDGRSSLLVASHGGLPKVLGAIAEFGPEAIADLNHAVQVAPKDAQAYYVRGAIYKLQFQNRYNLYSSLTDPSEKAQVNPDTSLARNAVADFKRATAIDPHLGKAYLELGKLYFVCLKFSDAAASLRKANEFGFPQNEQLLQKLDTVAKDPAGAGFTKEMLGSCALE